MAETREEPRRTAEAQEKTESALKSHAGTFPLPTEYIQVADKKIECSRKFVRILEAKELS